MRRRPSTIAVNFGSAPRLVRWCTLATHKASSRPLARSSRAMAKTCCTSTRSYQTSSGDMGPSSFMCSRYARTVPSTAAVRAGSSMLRLRAATATLAASRLTSHSHGLGSVSSKSLTSKIRFRSGVANTPKLARCASPQTCTRCPVTGVPARSSAMSCGRAAQEREGRHQHPLVSHGYEVRETGRVRRLESRHGIRSCGIGLPLRVHRSRHLLSERPTLDAALFVRLHSGSRHRPQR